MVNIGDRDIREADIELYLCAQIAKVYGTCEKFRSPGRNNVPDRIVMLPGGLIFFVECKAPGKQPTPAQQRDHDRRRALGQAVYVVCTYADVDRLIAEMSGQS